MLHIWSSFWYTCSCSCYPSICWGISLHAVVHNRNDILLLDWNCINHDVPDLHHVHWLHEQHGPLQFRIGAYLALQMGSSSKISHVYTIVSVMTSVSSLNLYLRFKIEWISHNHISWAWCNKNPQPLCNITQNPGRQVSLLDFNLHTYLSSLYSTIQSDFLSA